MAEIKQVKISNTAYDIAATYMLDGSGNLKDWAAIIALVNTAKLKILVCSTAANTPEGVTFTPKGSSTSITGTLTATAGDTQTFYFVYDGDGTNDSYLEYVTNGTIWEPLGKADVDLSGYVQKGVTYSNAALSAGSHDHSVTVPTISVDKTKKLGATATGTAVGADGTDTFVKSYPGTTSKLVTTTITGVSGSTSASKATAGTAFNAVKTVSISSNDTTATGRVAYVSAVSSPSLGGQTAVPTDAIKSVTLAANASTDTGRIAYTESVTAPSLGGTTTFNTDAIKSASLTGTTTFVIQPTVTDGVLEFTTASVGISSTPASTGTVSISGGTGTTKYLSASGNAATTANVTISGGTGTTKYLGVGTTTESVTPYTFTDVTVPTAAEAATTVATGALNANGAGSSVMTGLGTASTGSALTGVKVTAQPTITITEATTNTGPTIEHTTTGSTPATTSTTGAHTHDVNVANS